MRGGGPAARVLAELMPDEPEAQGLLALLLPARVAADGRLVRLAEKTDGSGTGI